MTELMNNIAAYSGQLSLSGVILIVLYILYQRERPNRLTGDNVSNINDFNQTLMTRVENLENTVERLVVENNKLRLTNQQLKTRLSIMESAHLDAPIPMWLKDRDGIMLSLNAAYEHEFLAPFEKYHDDYVGKTDQEFWAEIDEGTAYAIAETYSENDKYVQTTRSMWIGVEPVKTLTGVKNFAIMKYPRLEGKFLIGVAGLAIPQEMIDSIDFGHVNDGYTEENET